MDPEPPSLDPPTRGPFRSLSLGNHPSWLWSRPGSHQKLPEIPEAGGTVLEGGSINPKSGTGASTLNGRIRDGTEAATGSGVRHVPREPDALKQERYLESHEGS